MGFDIGDGSDFRDRAGFKLLTKQEIMARAEEVTRDGVTGEPLVIIPKDSDLGGVIEAQRICGFCRNWDLELGQETCHREKFWQRMFSKQEEAYRMEWFDNLASYGLCHVFEGRLIPSLAPAVCMAVDLDSSLRGKKGELDKKECPFFRDRRSSGGRLVMGAYTKTKLDHNE